MSSKVGVIRKGAPEVLISGFVRGSRPDSTNLFPSILSGKKEDWQTQVLIL